MKAIGYGLAGMAGALLSIVSAWAGAPAPPPAAVPEPASLALLVVGVGGVLALRQWRKRK